MAEYDFDDCRARLRHATDIVLSQEKAVTFAGDQAADSEAVYRAEVAKAFKSRRDGGEAVEAAKIGAHGDCVKWSRDRDVKATALKLAFERLEDARDGRRTTWRLVEWARGRDLARAGTPENVPGDKWP